MITKYYGTDFSSHGGALTLRKSDVTDSNDAYQGVHTKTHEDGWTITAELHEEYYVWVNAFDANHPIYGHVWGDFEHEVYADTEEGFNNFYLTHCPEQWDYMDI